MSDQSLGEFKVLPAEMMEEIFGKLSTVEAVRLCGSSQQFRELCKKYNILERLAQMEVKERAPYRTWDGPALEFIKLLEQDQVTWYSVYRPSAPGEPYDLLLMRDVEAEDMLKVMLPGTLLKNGKYWLFGSPDHWSSLGWYVFKTEEELDRRLSWY